MESARDCLELLRTETETTFILNDIGKISRENDPEHSHGPLLFMTGCGQGNITLLHAEVDDEVAIEIERIAATEPPMDSPDSKPVHLARYMALLKKQSGELDPVAGVSYWIPAAPEESDDVALVLSGTSDGDAILARLSDEGMPLNLLELGFRTAEDIWAPWCIALHRVNVASIAMSARLSNAGAECGVVTVPAQRRKGFAAAAVAGWSKHPDLVGKALFYSAERSNIASRRVAEKLGLTYIGATMRISRSGDSRPGI